MTKLSLHPSQQVVQDDISRVCVIDMWSGQSFGVALVLFKAVLLWNDVGSFKLIS